MSVLVVVENSSPKHSGSNPDLILFTSCSDLPFPLIGYSLSSAQILSVQWSSLSIPGTDPYTPVIFHI